jgi:outer membrane receptor protein involved in Fe transport
VFDRYDPKPDPLQDYIVMTPDRYHQDNTFRTRYYAAYAECSLKLNPVVTVNPSIRYERYSYEGRNYLSPRLSIRYQLTPEVSLNASGGIYYQLPELAVLSMEPSNAALKNERALHVIAGASAYLTNDLKCTVESYYKKFDDLLIRTKSYDNQYSNNGTGWASGFDVSLVKRFADKYYAQTSYSYTISKRDDHHGAGEYDYSYSKPHMFNILGGYQFSEEWSLTAKWMITSGLPKDEYIIHTNVLNNPHVIRYAEEIVKRNGRRFATNQSFDLRVDYRKQFSFMAVSVYLDIWNLFGTKNVASEEFLPQSGTFSSETLGMVPTFGFNIEL